MSGCLFLDNPFRLKENLPVIQARDMQEVATEAAREMLEVFLKQKISEESVINRWKSSEQG